jgi:hypothetical protein
MRSDMLDEELLSLMERCGNTLKPSKGKKKARSQGSQRMDHSRSLFDGEMWKHFEALQGNEESERPRRSFLKYLFLPVDEVRRF